LKQKLHSQNSKIILAKQSYSSAQHYSSLAKAHIAPKTVHSCGKTKFISQLNSQCPQNA